MNKKKSKEDSQYLTDDAIMKYEIAEELGLFDKVKQLGWGGLTAKETGKIGGLIRSKRERDKKGK